MQSQIREVMHQSHPSTTSLSAPPGHGDVQYQHDGGYAYSQPTMANENKRPSAFKQFSSRFSTGSFVNGSSASAHGAGETGRYMSDEQRVKHEDLALHHSQMGWLDRARQRKNFSILVFSALTSVMLLIIFLTAMIWIGLKIIEPHKFTVLAANVNIGST